MRISKRGYIETPTKGKDIFLCAAKVYNHIKCVELIGNVLTFTPYTEDDIEGLGHNILQNMNSSPETDREKAFSVLLNVFPQRINTMIMWEDSFEFAVL